MVGNIYIDMKKSELKEVIDELLQERWTDIFTKPLFRKRYLGKKALYRKTLDKVKHYRHLDQWIKDNFIYQKKYRKKGYHYEQVYIGPSIGKYFQGLLFLHEMNDTDNETLQIYTRWCEALCEELGCDKSEIEPMLDRIEDNFYKNVMNRQYIPESGGVGWVYDKDMKKDPKHIKGERWRIKFDSDSKPLKENATIKVSEIKKSIHELLKEMGVKEANNPKRILGNFISKPMRNPNMPGEWIVKWLVNGKRDENKTFYTDDEKDAWDTYKQMVQHANEENQKLQKQHGLKNPRNPSTNESSKHR